MIQALGLSESVIKHLKMNRIMYNYVPAVYDYILLCIFRVRGPWSRVMRLKERLDMPSFIQEAHSPFVHQTTFSLVIKIEN